MLIGRVADASLGRWLAARVRGRLLLAGTLAGRWVDHDHLDRDQIEDIARYLAAALADIAAAAHDGDRGAAATEAVDDLHRARADLDALHRPAPDHVPPAWSQPRDPSPMVDVWVSVAYAAPGPACVDCAGPLPADPPWYLRGIAGPLCLSCARQLAGARYVARVEAARAALAATPADDHDTRAAIAARLLASG